MQCRNEGCPGEYEAREILHLMGRKGNPIVIAHVPAEVCAVCGDILFTPDTVRQLEVLRRQQPKPVGMIPLYEFTDIGNEQSASEAMHSQAVAD